MDEKTDLSAGIDYSALKEFSMINVAVDKLGVSPVHE